jgi:Holliday junction resolvase RusA-like endonuclease
MRTLTLPEPPSANRWWRAVTIPAKGGKPARTQMLLSADARKYKKSLEQLSGLAVHDGPVRVSVEWYRGRRSGDLDKRLGVVFDALQGVLYANDNQIVEINARRFDDPGNARIVVTVEPCEAVQETLL